MHNDRLSKLENVQTVVSNCRTVSSELVPPDRIKRDYDFGRNSEGKVSQGFVKIINRTLKRESDRSSLSFSPLLSYFSLFPCRILSHVPLRLKAILSVYLSLSLSLSFFLRWQATITIFSFQSQKLDIYSVGKYHRMQEIEKVHCPIRCSSTLIQYNESTLNIKVTACTFKQRRCQYRETRYFN